MKPGKDTYIVYCDCGDKFHPVVLEFCVDRWKDTFDKKRTWLDLDISLRIEDVGFWGRVKNALFYVWKQRKFWHYGDVSLNMFEKDNVEVVKGLIKYLQRVLKETDETMRKNKQIEKNEKQEAK